MQSVMNLGGQHEHPGSPPKAKRPRRAIACACCRSRKVKCDGGRPKCHNCRLRNQTCVYAKGRRDLMASDIQPQYPPTSTTERNTEPSGYRAGVDHNANRAHFAEAAPQFLPEITNPSISGRAYPPETIPFQQGEVGSGCLPDLGLGGLGVGEQSRYPSPPMEESVSSIAPPEHEHWEYHGPGSYLSICSKAGVQWVIDQSMIPDFTNVTRNFSREISHVLKLDKPLALTRARQPDAETARQYIRVFFDELPEATFGVVLRGPFETRFSAYCRDTRSQPLKDYNSEWYALRNIIWAYGARAVQGKSQDTSTFVQASQEGTKYLENALSRLPDLLCCRCSLTAIEALILMALYVEGVGCQAIEYTLCSDALRLAYSKGLHRQPGTAWGISPEQVEHRNRLFWVIYLFEKHIAYRSGRPSTIDDSDISCHLPVRISPSSEYCWLAFKHAQLSSQIARRFHTVRAYSQSADTCVARAAELESKLKKWNEMIPAAMRPGAVVSSTDVSIHPAHAIYLHCAYYGGLISIHAVFTNPWSPIYTKCQTESLRKQVERSSNVVADASRQLILATRYITDILASTPTWLVLYYPILGLINLFVHILRNPSAPTVMSDIALLDVVTGHLARLEFSSGGTVCFSFAREVSNISRAAVRNVSVPRETPKTPSNVGRTSDHISAHIDDDQNTAPNENLFWDDFDLPDSNRSDDYDIENWSTLLPMLGLEGMSPPLPTQPGHATYSPNTDSLMLGN